MGYTKLIDALASNYYSGRKLLGFDRAKRVYYVVPEAGWSVDWDGYYITKGINEQFGPRAFITSKPHKIAGQVVHYGSLWEFLGNIEAPHNHRNRIVITVFHGNRDDEAFRDPINKVLRAQDLYERVVVTNRIMLKRFLEWGIPKTKIALIPLGVDLSLFRPPLSEERERVRHELGIPESAICIGSFHKDGEGWEEGLKPKLIKGPDILMDVLARLKKGYPNIFVLLSGPARGYIKQNLGILGIPYKHIYFEDATKVAGLYHALDTYLVTSREEGGPKGVLEALAAGVPLVSTKVGLVPDLVEHESEGLLAEIEDVDGLVAQVSRLIDHPSLRSKLIQGGMKKIQAYGWRQIATRYYREVYEPLLAIAA